MLYRSFCKFLAFSVKFLICFGIFLLCLDFYPFSAFAADSDSSGHHGGGGKSRFVPYAPFNDILNDVNDALPFSLSDLLNGLGVIQNDFSNSLDDVSTDVLQTWDKFKNYLSTYMYTNVTGQRVKDLVDYANQSTMGLTTGRPVTSFIAKRSLTLSYDSNNQPDLVETDTMYFWKDENHTIASDFSGVQIGNFYMQPNTVLIIREFSDDREPILFYADATQFTLTYSDSISGLNNEPFQIRLRDGTFTCVNSDGSVESITLGSSYSYLYFQALKSASINSIDAGDALASQALYNPRYNEFTNNGILPNIAILVTNAERSDGSILLPNNYRGGQAGSFGTWFLSSGAFFPINNSTSDGTFNTQTTIDLDPRKPPAIKNPDLRLQTNTLLTTANVDNYADFGITYNSLTGKFDLDLNSLAAGLAAQIAPQFDAVFDGVYSAQPDIDSNSWSFDSLTNNYVDDYASLVVDIDNKVQEIIDSRSPVWVPPRYPAVNTTVYIPATVPSYETYAVQTVPSGLISQSGTWLRMSYDIFDDLGLVVIVIPLVILGLFWRFTGGD